MADRTVEITLWMRRLVNARPPTGFSENKQTAMRESLRTFHSYAAGTDLTTLLSLTTDAQFASLPAAPP